MGIDEAKVAIATATNIRANLIFIYFSPPFNSLNNAK
jgi:hypothetical protein